MKTITHTPSISLRNIRYKKNPTCTTANSPFEMRLVEATLTFVEERKCHLENQQLAVTGLQGDEGYLCFLRTPLLIVIRLRQLYN